jgi:hypothetical protein
MARGATSGLPGTRKGSVPAKTVATALMACVMVLSAFFWAHSVVTAQAITFNGMVPPYPGTPVQEIPRYIQTSQDWEAAASAAVARGGMSADVHKVEDVRARQYLRVVVHVRDLNGAPLRREQILISWRSRGVRTVESAITNEKGDASVLHWVAAADRDHTVVVTAWADTISWSNGTYAWFVPE